MNKKYKDMLSSLTNDEMPKSADDRILIIDGLNTFIRKWKNVYYRYNRFRYN